LLIQTVPLQRYTEMEIRFSAVDFTKAKLSTEAKLITH